MLRVCRKKIDLYSALEGMGMTFPLKGRWKGFMLVAVEFPGRISEMTQLRQESVSYLEEGEVQSEMPLAKGEA